MTTPRCFRFFSLASVLALASACVVSETSPPPQAAPPPPPLASPAPAQPSGPLPAGLYSVSEQVLFDSCHPSRVLPSQVTVMKRYKDGRALLNVPVPTLGFGNHTIKRVESSELGYQGSGMAHPKICPGTQQTFKERFYDVTANSFRISVDYEVKDGWDCPNPRPQALCQTRVVYTYTLSQPACDSRCEGTVPNVRDRDVPAGPTALTCSCTQSV